MPSWKPDAVADVPHATQAGNVALPIQYTDTTYFMAVFRAAFAEAQQRVAPFGLQAVRLHGEAAVAVLTFANYGHSTIGHYLECGLAIAAVRKGADPSIRSLLSLWRNSPRNNGIGYLVLHLPVTTELACAAGREIWGYPKFVAPIRAVLDGARVDGEVTDPASGASILRLTGRTGLAIPSQPLDVDLYSRADGNLLRAVVETRGMGWLCSPGSVRLDGSMGTHPMTQTIAALGLRGARAAVVFRAHALQLRLHGASHTAPVP
jgi:hypothetical protein